MRVTTAFNRLLALSGVSVNEMMFEADTVVVDVVLRRRRLCCPQCTFSTAAGYAFLTLERLRPKARRPT